MYFNRMTKLATAVAIVFGLSACGGGGGGGTASSSTVGTAAVGTITGFGSVFINGVEYNTAGATITVEGSPASESDLAVGMVASVEGSASGASGVALSIDVSDEIEGLVQSNAVPAGGNSGTLVVMGQTVNVDANTLFESKVAGITALDQIAGGNIVEVNGYGDGAGQVFATRIEVKAADLATYLAAHPDGIEVKGVVGNLDSAAGSFRLGSLPVDYNGAVLDAGLTLTDGVYVEVRSVSGLDGSGTLVASKVDLQGDGVKGHRGSENEDFEMRGIISTAFDGSGFGMDGTRIRVSDATELKRGSKAGLLAGVMVTVEGTFDANGVLNARELKFEDRGDRELKDTVTAVSTTGVNSGTVTLQDGSVITVDNSTIMKDSRRNGMMPDPRFNLQALGTGDYVEVHVYSDSASGDLVAVKLERTDP
ncbi:MAG TPA: hypothetical protein ENK05_12995 [Gammaproteobacteria bacterium]|nr:hypothetical protein [Gammaproteobacteria bacterium]